MIKTVPFDIVASFLIGMAVPLICAENVRRAPSLVKNRYFLGTVLFELFFFAPLGVYLYFFYPDWSLMFFVDPAKLSPLAVKEIGVASLLTYLLAVMGGFILAAALVRKDQAGKAWIALLGLALALGVFSLITVRQLSGVGSYAQWIAVPRATAPLYAHRVGYLTGLDTTVAAAVLFFMLRSFRREQLGRP